MTTTTCPNLRRFDDETQWIARVRRILQQDDEETEASGGDDQDDPPISIFDVLKPLLCTKPEAYVPQLVSLGPYHHHRREELRDMEMYKLSAARRAQAHLPSMNLQQLVDAFASSQHRIRAHYHRHLDVSNEALAWMMAIDVSFLVEFLQSFSKTTTNGGSGSQRTTTAAAAALQRIPSRVSHLVNVDPSRRRTSSSHSMLLLRDLVMLENQIPLFLLVKAVELRTTSPSSSSDRTAEAEAQAQAQHVVRSMLSGFLEEVSSFTLSLSLRRVTSPCTAAAADDDDDDVTRHAHLLGFLYANMVPPPLSSAEEEEPVVEDAGDTSHHQHMHRHDSLTGLIFRRGMKLALLLADVMVRILLRFAASLPCLAVAMLRRPIQQLTSAGPAAKEGAGAATASSDVEESKNVPPLLEEIAVPSVAELAYAGVKFSPTNGGLSTIEFCGRTATLRLPVITVDMTTEVVLRNLVAYEASVGSSRAPLVLARYVELMNGIIDTGEDARVLRESGVIINRLKSDREVAELWNGMTRSVRLTRVPALDRVIDDLNRHHSRCWKVRVRTFARARLVVGSTKDLAAACVLLIFLVLFVILQAFCVSRSGLSPSLKPD